MNPLTILHTLLCVALFYTCFCRLVHTTRASTYPAVRWAFAVCGGMALFGTVWPLAFDYAPRGIDVGLLAGFTLVQVITSRLWRHGVPAQLCKPCPCGHEEGHAP